MSGGRLEIKECDEAGNVTATYVQSTNDDGNSARIDTIKLPNETKSLAQKTLDIFLPTGYPHSVTEDYLEYQIYDSLQAFSSSIAGMLSSRAVLSSVGVGDSTASPTAALLLSVLQESVGRIATILFAHRFGTSLEPECKMYRLLADILNDIAFILDCLSPAFPKAIRVVVLSFSSALRALCGVAAGSAKASLSAHFAKWGNLGELNAKDSSQETVISLMGMLAGSLVVSSVTSPAATWFTLILLLSIHLETNRRAVRAVSMRTLNRQRATLVYHHLRRGHVPTPDEVSQNERIFERDGVLRDRNDRIFGYCHIGGSISQLFRSIGDYQSKTRSAVFKAELLQTILSMYEGQNYLLHYTRNCQHKHFDIFLKKPAVATDLVIGWWQAHIFADKGTQTLENKKQSGSKEHPDTQELIMQVLRQSKQAATEMLRTNEKALRAAGWDLDAGALETSSSLRFTIDS